MKTLWVVLFLGMMNLAVADVTCPEDSSRPSLHEALALMDTVDPVVESKISFYGEINKSSMNRLIKRIDKEVQKHQGQRLLINLNLSSGGGDINETIRAIKHIREINSNPLIEIDTIVAGHNSCESACTILYTAGEKRKASEKSRFGFHSPRFQKGKLGNYTKKEIEEKYRGIWLSYISQVDETTAARVESSRYLYDDEMSYISGRDLQSGYVTDLI